MPIFPLLPLVSTEGSVFIFKYKIAYSKFKNVVLDVFFSFQIRADSFS